MQLKIYQRFHNYDKGNRDAELRHGEVFQFRRSFRLQVFETPKQIKNSNRNTVLKPR